MRLVLAMMLLYFSAFGASITVASAANMSYALPKIIEAFHRHYPDVDVKMVVASSGKLATQIARGAPFDLFLSADMEYPKWLHTKGLTQSPPRVYAKGELVFISKKIDTLQKISSLRRIALANPTTAPYGKAAKEVLEHLGLWQKLQGRYIFGESVAQSFLYATKAAEGGFVAKSSLFAPQSRAWQKFIIEIDPALYDPIEQGAVLLVDSNLSRLFFNFLFSKEAAKILRSYGYRVDD